MASIKDLVSKLLNEKGGVGGGGIPVREVPAMRMQSTPLTDSDPMMRDLLGPSGAPVSHIVSPIHKGIPWWDGSRTQSLLGGQNPLELDRTQLAKLLSEAGINPRTVSAEFTGGHLLDQFNSSNPWEAMLLRFKTEGLSPEQIPSIGYLSGDRAKKLGIHGAYNPAQNRILINLESPLPQTQRPQESLAGVVAHEGEHALSKIKHGEIGSRPERLFPESLSNKAMGGPQGTTPMDYYEYLNYLMTNGSPAERKAAQTEIRSWDKASKYLKPSHDSDERAALSRIRVARMPLAPNPDMVNFVQSTGHMRPEIHTDADLPMYYMTKESATMGADPGVWGQYFPTALEEGKNAFENRLKMAPWLGVFDAAQKERAVANARVQAMRRAAVIGAGAAAGVGGGLGLNYYLKNSEQDDEIPDGAGLWPMMMFGRGLEEYAPLIQGQ